VLENDLLEAIIALPTDIFYKTGISTSIWILSKRKEMSPMHIDAITHLFGSFEEAENDGKPVSKIFRNEAFGYRTITV
jgi:type I restriction enzyme M protein